MKLLLIPTTLVVFGLWAGPGVCRGQNLNLNGVLNGLGAKANIRINTQKNSGSPNTSLWNTAGDETMVQRSKNMGRYVGKNYFFQRLRTVSQGDYRMLGEGSVDEYSADYARQALRNVLTKDKNEDEFLRKMLAYHAENKKNNTQLFGCNGQTIRYTVASRDKSGLPTRVDGQYEYVEEPGKTHQLNILFEDGLPYDMWYPNENLYSRRGDDEGMAGYLRYTPSQQGQITRLNDRDAELNRQYRIANINPKINDSLTQLVKTRFSGADCQACLSRTTEAETRTERAFYMTDPNNGNDIYHDVTYTVYHIKVQNKCNKGLRVVGISQYGAGRGAVYHWKFKTYGPLQVTEWSRSMKDMDMIGGIIGAMLFGGGEAEDIDLSHINKPYDTENGGDVQYLRIVENTSGTRAAAAAVGGATTAASGGSSKAGAAPAAAKAAGQQQVEVDSEADVTEIAVRKGDRIHLRASGTVVTGSFSGACGPAGKPWINTWNIMPDLNYGALLVTVGPEGTWEAVGQETTYVAPATGKLRLAINDTDPKDNRGSFLVAYSIDRAGGAAAKAPSRPTARPGTTAARLVAAPATSRRAPAASRAAEPAADPAPMAPAALATAPAPPQRATAGSRNAAGGAPAPAASARASAPVAGSAAPATAPTPTAPVAPATVQTVTITGHWTKKKTTWNMPCNMALDIDVQNNAHGVINWSVGKVDPASAAQYRDKMSATAQEFVEGTYNPTTKTVQIHGTAKEDPAGIIGLETYEISLLNSNAAMGKSKTNGTWEGSIFGLYRLATPVR